MFSKTGQDRTEDLVLILVLELVLMLVMALVLDLVLGCWLRVMRAFLQLTNLYFITGLGLLLFSTQ